MQLLHENKIKRNKEIMNNFNMNASITMKDTSSSLEVKEKDSSNASLLLMNAVPSGDNVTTGLSAHRLKDELPILPPLVPCCEGKELQINEDLVRSGLSAISVKHDSVVHCLSMSQACERTQVQPGLVKHRNSFRSLHRPDLKRVPYLRRMTPDELEKLFRGYADFPKCHDHKNTPEDVTKIKFAPIEGSQTRDYKHKNVSKDGNYAHSRQAIFEARSRAEDVPSGMRLHGTRARLYTSVLAGARTGDQLDVISTNEDDTKVPDEVVPEDEIQLHEELQIILPPRCDDVTADSSITATSADTIT